jgi:hypothetical protein
MYCKKYGWSKTVCKWNNKSDQYEYNRTRDLVRLIYSGKIECKFSPNCVDEISKTIGFGEMSLRREFGDLYSLLMSKTELSIFE